MNLEPVVIGGVTYQVRHVGPRVAVWPGSPAADVTLLACPSMVARPLPQSGAPASPDFVSGSWTGRLLDAGEMQLTFPNANASDGLPWRARFDPAGHLQFLEVYCNGLLDSVCVIDTVACSQQQITVHGQDGWFLLKKAYVRDWTVTMAPRDVVERATQVWVPVVADNFTLSTPYNSELGANVQPQWTLMTNGTVQAGGGLLYSIANTSGTLAELAAQEIPCSSSVWRASATIQWSDIGVSSNTYIEVDEQNGSYWQVNLYGGKATFVYHTNVASFYLEPPLSPAASYSLMLESDGEWVFAFCNGTLIGCARRASGSTGGTVSFTVALQASGATPPATVQALVLDARMEACQPFLQRGSDHGDYVLPGDASTYPSGGLHARYFNDLDLAGFEAGEYLARIMTPDRTVAWGGQAEYANQQDPNISVQQNPNNPGAATSNWSCRWFGAVWLPLSKGDFAFQINMPGASGSGVACRVWVGKTRFGDQLVDEWTASAGGLGFGFTVSASALAGNPGYGATPVARDGWYPIKVEYAALANVTAPQLFFNSPVAYTDPGGTKIAVGTIVVPSTSLSPLGCVDQRYQGVSHFDLVQQTCEAYGYQAAVEPAQLESGLFPGVLAPRLREGHSTDVILAPDTGIRQDGEGIVNYSSTVDATDFAASLQGNGAGFQSGTVGQLQAVVYDAPTMLASLFDAQQWQDFSDASFISLLQALLNSQLGLQLAPWQLLSADPTGRSRLAETWPLPGTLAQMRWRPGDSLRIQAPDINVRDTAPRQMLVFTRNITPDATTGSQASFADRPRNQARTLRRAFYAATRQQRSYQRQVVSLNGTYCADQIAAGAGQLGSVFSAVLLRPGDQVLSARVRIAYISGTSPNVTLANYVAGWRSLQAQVGSFTQGPVDVNVTSVIQQDPATSRVVFNVWNLAANAVGVEFQLYVDVLR